MALDPTNFLDASQQQRLGELKTLKQEYTQTLSRYFERKDIIASILENFDDFYTAYIQLGSSVSTSDLLARANIISDSSIVENNPYLLINPEFSITLSTDDLRKSIENRHSENFTDRLFNNVDEIIRYLEREELYINGNSAILGDWFKGVNEKVVVEDRKEALNQILRDIRTNRLEGIEGPLPS
jgi:hypothetical protein